MMARFQKRRLRGSCRRGALKGSRAALRAEDIRLLAPDWPRPERIFFGEDRKLSTEGEVLQALQQRRAEESTAVRSIGADDAAEDRKRPGSRRGRRFQGRGAGHR